jgi:hypothetical protein
VDLITRDLGTLTPTREWQSYGLFSVGGESYRMTAIGNRNLFQGWIELRCVYRNNDVSGTARFYLDAANKIIELPLPNFLETATIKDRLWQIRRNTKYWRTPLGISPVSIKLEEITGVDD